MFSYLVFGVLAVVVAGAAWLLFKKKNPESATYIEDIATVKVDAVANAVTTAVSSNTSGK